MKNSDLKKHLPVTRWFNRQNVYDLLQKYKMVYIKPNKGRFGLGVMKIEKLKGSGSNRFRYQYGVKVRQYTSFEKMYDSIKKRELNL